MANGIAAPGCQSLSSACARRPSRSSWGFQPARLTARWLQGDGHEQGCMKQVVLVLGLLHGGRARRLRRLTRTRATGEQALTAVENIRRRTEDQRRNKRMSQKERQQLRSVEVKRKMTVLKGNKYALYKKNRDAAKAKKDQSEEDDEDETDEKEGKNAATQRPRTDANASELAAWAFSRREADKKAHRTSVSDEALAIAETELRGSGSAATAAMLIEAAAEFKLARQWSEASELLELARKKITQEQLAKSLDWKVAEDLENEALRELGSVYANAGRLTLAYNYCDQLRRRPLDPMSTTQAEAELVEVAFRLGEKLHEERRFQQCMDVLESVRELSQRNVAGAERKEELEIYIAMALQSLNRKEEAKQVLKNVIRITGSAKRKAQAIFIMDVHDVDISGERNEEFHKIWDQNFKLPTGSQEFRDTSRRSTVNLNLSETEREFRTWVSAYWEERLKSPAYYAFLVLWVTWPFAIPVVAIARRSGLID
eukprot:TRINITY_DN62329_c0_g1_i1.p1 TRINITY_DN62329_c0_g1~~TRINITY_DN62329_c0_g1_i1.p1  ORF type:complete len:485 (-),score=104.03 TRINITY_DN62329_c0_g1_i1:175-1629(-)